MVVAPGSLHHLKIFHFRWEESKKWKHKVEHLRSKLKEADAEVSKLSKTNKGLREINR